MPKDTTPGKPTTRRYSLKRRPLRCGWSGRCVRSWALSIGRWVQRVAAQFGYGTESVRSWVRQADIDEGHVPGGQHQRRREDEGLEQENRELKRANEILKRAASFFGAELDRQHKK